MGLRRRDRHPAVIPTVSQRLSIAVPVRIPTDCAGVHGISCLGTRGRNGHGPIGMGQGSQGLRPPVAAAGASVCPESGSGTAGLLDDRSFVIRMPHRRNLLRLTLPAAGAGQAAQPGLCTGRLLYPDDGIIAVAQRFGKFFCIGAAAQGADVCGVPLFHTGRRRHGFFVCM